MKAPTDRRQFLKTIAEGGVILGAGTLAGPTWAFASTQPKIGLQLYTVRDDLKKDLDGTLRAVAAIGYREVETAPDETPAKTLAAALSANGLSTPSGHCATFHVAEQPDTMIERTKTLGQKFLICAWPQGLDANLHCDRSRDSHKLTMDDFRRHAELFNRFGEQCRKAGIQFGYHNHNFEFREQGGVIPYDDLLQRTDAKLVKLEVDCYWVSRAGKDPVDFLRKYGDRIQLLHIKDMKPVSAPAFDTETGGDAFTEVGTGTIGWRRIFDEAGKTGVRYAFIEQDKCARPPVESARMSYENLQKLLQ